MGIRVMDTCNLFHSSCFLRVLFIYFTLFFSVNSLSLWFWFRSTSILRWRFEQMPILRLTLQKTPKFTCKIYFHFFTFFWGAQIRAAYPLKCNLFVQHRFVRIFRWCRPHLLPSYDSEYGVRLFWRYSLVLCRSRRTFSMRHESDRWLVDFV